MNWRERHGPSDSQANALARRDRPYRKDNESSLKLRGPESLSDLKREFREAAEAEMPQALQSNAGVEDGSALGTPRWTSGFRSFVMGNAKSRDKLDGYFIHPLRASIAVMAESRDSAIERNAAALLYLVLLRGDFDHTEAWRTLLGIFREDEFVRGTADPQANEALRRWWKVYSREPRRASIPQELPFCAHPTPLCPHGEVANAA